jgi:hypothetical protein
VEGKVLLKVLYATRGVVLSSYMCQNREQNFAPAHTGKGKRNSAPTSWPNRSGENTLLCGSGRKEVIPMRAVDNSNQKSAAVLRVLLVWKQLPESDVARMLHTYFLTTDDFREMEEQGLLTLSFSGDEYILSPTTLGRLWLEQFTGGE